MTVEVCLAPALYKEKLTQKGFNTVITDIFRATTSVVAALDYGIESIIPVPDLAKAREFKKMGFVVAAEREGKKLDFSDIGNSATEFQNPDLKGKRIAYSTTNGVKAIKMAMDADHILLGAFMNLSAVANWLAKDERAAVIFCAGWKNKVNLEDTLFAGALAEKLISEHGFSTNCDATHLALDIWEKAKKDLLGYIEKASHRHRLAHVIDQNLLEFTFAIDSSSTVPIYQDGRMIPA
jgi:2-phosphosulfolactate phosphatase